jgi:DNA polymerase I
MRTFIIDTETNGIKDYTKLHNIVLREVHGNNVLVYRRSVDGYNDFLSFITSVPECTLVGHHVIGFDYGVLSHFFPSVNWSSYRWLDTLVISRLLNYNKPGGHSIEDWGTYFGATKSKFSDFSEWSQELEDRCIIDTEINLKLYNFFKKYIDDPTWQKAIQLEHDSAFLCEELSRNGFYFDVTSAQSLHKELSKKVDTFQQSFKEVFLPKTIPIKTVNPKLTKKGSLSSVDFRWKKDNDYRQFTPEAPFSLFEWQDFNPNSPLQRVERLNLAGWKPVNKTKGYIKAEQDLRMERSPVKKKELETKIERYKTYGWTCDEENLATLPEDAPESAKTLAEYLLISSRLGDLTEWLNLYNPATNRIHGRFNHIGSWTHRKAHQAPNMANIPALVNRKGGIQPYGAELRGLFSTPDSKVLVGCDAEGIQLRIFAHLCNDQRLIAAIENGKKEDKTDIHSLNKAVLDTICNSREIAKTYIYALLLGAGIGKQASILQVSKKQALEGLERILAYYPGWKELVQGRLKEEGKKGFFVGLDGRKVLTPSPHKVLAGHLQNGESTIMKMAARVWHKKLTTLDVPFMFVNDVHDEWQTETTPEFADVVGRTQAASISEVGAELGLNCKLSGEYKIGKTWRETH